ncbi:MAG: hypothetical protein KatS3mg131_2818 [Candidatus Tectimicrobiota bacterium]|nr:MAG: hypothetical protein KatS3mg131_2818 [Candidatus Tectomicrobia bacterium]
MPIVVLSALPDEHLALQAVQAGAQDYLVKGQTEAPLLERALRYAIERHRLARALEQARQRQQQEQELRSLDRLSHTAPAAVTAHLFGDAPLRQTAPEVFQAWVARYGSLLDMALEQRAYKVDHRLSAHLRTLAEELGFMHAGPRDVIDVHTQALHPKLRDVLPEKAQAYLEEGRMLVLELMGHLVAVYRVYALGRRSGGESRLAP